MVLKEGGKLEDVDRTVFLCIKECLDLGSGIEFVRRCFLHKSEIK